MRYVVPSKPDSARSDVNTLRRSSEVVSLIACPTQQVTGFVRVLLPLLKPTTFGLGELVVTPKIGTREMGFILSGEVEVR